jgi:hypothetical protein
MFRKRLRNIRIFKRMAIFGGVKSWGLAEDGNEDWVELGPETSCDSRSTVCWPLSG